MPKSKSSVAFSTSVSNEVADVISRIAESEGVSTREVVRRAVIEYVKSAGYEVKDYTPKRGERTDLHYATDGELKALGERLKKARASARAAKESRAAAPSVPAAASKPRSRSRSAA